MSADGITEVTTERDSKRSSDSGRVIWWVLSAIVVGISLIMFLAVQLRNLIQNNVGTSMPLGSAVLIVLFIIGAILFRIFSASGGHRTRTDRYKAPRCGFVGPQSRRPCIRPAGHSGHHRYR